MTGEVSLTRMEVHMNGPQLDDVTGARVDGALADDERTEAERSPETKAERLTLELTPDVVKLADTLSGDDVTAPVNGDSLKGKRRNRRKGKGGKHHCKKWKPYTKLSWEEKRIQDERESRRANQRREQRFASGQPMAPYNTTQFLMEQHGETDMKIDGSVEAPAVAAGGVIVEGRAAPLHSISVSGEGSGSMDSSEEYYSSPDDEEIFQQKDFSEEYDNFHAERLQAMSKDELVREYLELEGKIEKLEKHTESGSLTEEPDRAKGSIKMDAAPNPGLPSSRLQEELQKLKAENELLKTENDTLRAGMLNNVTFDNKENEPQS